MYIILHKSSDFANLKVLNFSWLSNSKISCARCVNLCVGAENTVLIYSADVFFS